MPPYSQLQLQDLWFMLGIGLFIAISIILVRGTLKFTLSSRDRDPDREHPEEHTKFGGGVTEGHGPMPIYFIMVVIGWALWATGYVIYRSMT